MQLCKKFGSVASNAQQNKAPWHSNVKTLTFHTKLLKKPWENKTISDTNTNVQLQFNKCAYF
jgi:hypothetical protein